jgi:capsular exopolysaccharide synthesis family protein
MLTPKRCERSETCDEADRILHENYLSQYNEMFERRTLLNASARIISPASLPKAPSSSRKKMIYAAAAALGLGCGVVIALLRELLRPGIKTCVDAERSFGLPVMGVIPALTDGKVRKISHDRLVDMIIKEPFSDLGRAVQTLRVCLELSSAGSKVVLVTSAIAAEGKSTTAMLLGASSVASGKKTVLLDCDLHRQVLSGELSRGSRPTLSELLQGTATIAEVLTIDPMTKAYLIPAGAGQSNPADLLMSKQMGDLIAVLRRDFDYIIIDAPPLLPVIDALVLSTVVDKVLMVVEWSNTPRASISEAFKVLRSEVDRVAGIVLNKVDLDRLPEHRYGGYRGSYRYRDNYRPDPGA